MNTHKAFITIMLIIVFTILIFTVSNKERNDIVESFNLGDKKKTQSVPEEIQQSIKQVVQEVVERAKQQGVGGGRLQAIQTAANNVVSGALGCINEEDTAILNEQRNLIEIMEEVGGEIAELKSLLDQQQQQQQQTNETITHLKKTNATLQEKLEKAQGVAKA